MAKDYYKILEVSHTATIEEIKKSYRRLALKYHPDRNAGDKLSENKFKEIAEAYEILSDIEKRKDYDFSYNRDRQERTSYSRQEGQSKQKEEPITPLTFLGIFQDMRKKITAVDRKQLNQKNIFNSLMDLLQENNINFLRAYDDRNINNSIIDEVKKCIRRLDYKYVEPVCIKLVSLAGTDNEEIQNIFKFSKQCKYRSYYYEYQGLIIVLAIFLFLGLIGALNSSSTSNENINRPQTGDVYTNTAPPPPPINLTPTINSNTQINTPKEDYSDWDKTNYSTGSSPSCYNFKASYDESIDNELKIDVGSHTDVVIKLINLKTRKCIRYVYIRSGNTFDIRHIPQGKYFVKIAYGKDWRTKIINGKCIGKFTQDALYKKGEKILDFNKVYEGIVTEGDKEYENYSIPSFSLSLDVVETDYQNSFESNQISEDDFND